MAKDNSKIKCIVWDLDNTVWHGILSEDKEIKLNMDAVQAIREFDSRGILQSIASKNYHNDAMKKLDFFGLKDYFLYPKINWNPKSESIKKIAEKLNIGLDTFAFIDDQSFELDEVNFALKDVKTFNASDISNFKNSLPFIPKFITEDSKNRRKMYQFDIMRDEEEESFAGSQESFLKTLQMNFLIRSASEDDLQRAEELTVRTHQLNTTGYTYSYEELNAFRVSNDHKLFIAELTDKYGTYGKIGLVLLETRKQKWIIKLLLMSCRVMSRGVGAILINHIRKLAKEENVALEAEFISTDRNRMMYMAYKFANFTEKEKFEDFILFENDLSLIPDTPSYFSLKY